MALQSDSQGFLVGDPIDISKVVDQLRRIRSDVSEIKRALLGASSNNSDSHNARSSSGGSNPRVRSGRESGAATPNRPRSSNSSGGGLPPVNPNGTATPNGRGHDGRFLGNGQSSSESDSRKMQGVLGGFADRITTAVKASAAGAEEADPTIKAFQEVAEPMRRGYEIFTGGGDKKERWFKKIFKELKLFRKDESVFNRAANQSLDNIEGNPGVGSGEGGQSFLGGLLGSISPWVMAAITGIGGALLTGVTAVLGVIFSPIGLAIGAAATVAWGLFTESGQKFFGEVGAKIITGWDAVVTAFAPITESISKGWDTVKGGFDSLINGMVSSWDAFTGFLKDKFGIDLPSILKPVVDAGKQVVEATKETVKAGTDAAKSTASKAIEAVEKSSPKTTEALGNAWDRVKDGVSKIKSHATGKTAENKNALINQMAESGITDPKEQAMFMAEMDHESGGFTKMEESFNYRSADRLMGISKSARSLGKPAIEAAIAQGPEAVAEAMYGGRMGNVNKGDAYAFRGRGPTQLTGRDNYAAAGKDLGLDLVNNPDLAAHPENAAKIAAWYWKKNKLGDSAKKGDVKTNRHGVNGGEIGLADVEQKFDKYLVAANNGEFNTSAIEDKNSADPTPAVVSTKDDPIQGGRYNATNANDMPLYHQFAAGPGNSAQVQTASATSPRVPTFAPPPPIAEAPPLIQPLASDSSRNLTVTMPTPDVGQDVRDRGIAHIVTGGLSGRG